MNRLLVCALGFTVAAIIVSGVDDSGSGLSDGEYKRSVRFVATIAK